MHIAHFQCFILIRWLIVSVGRRRSRRRHHHRFSQFCCYFCVFFSSVFRFLLVRVLTTFKSMNIEWNKNATGEKKSRKIKETFWIHAQHRIIFIDENEQRAKIEQPAMKRIRTQKKTTKTNLENDVFLKLIMYIYNWQRFFSLQCSYKSGVSNNIKTAFRNTFLITVLFFALLLARLAILAFCVLIWIICRMPISIC